MEGLKQVIEKGGLVALASTALFLAGWSLWMVAPGLLIVLAALALLIVGMRWSMAERERGSVDAAIEQWLGSRWRNWSALSIIARYSALGFLAALLGICAAFLYRDVELPARAAQQAKEAAERQRTDAAATRKTEEERERERESAMIPALEREADQRLSKTFKIWADFEVLPVEQRTPERARETEAKANEQASGLRTAYAEMIRGKNAVELRRELEKIKLLNTPLAERVALALTLLGDGESSDAICKARAELANVLPKDRIDPAFKSASKTVRAKEASYLRGAWQEAVDSRGLVCRDGTSSPSCMCGGPRRGCCSHHGGVAGCDPMPVMEQELTCPK